jgi:hypothetical protein
LCEENFVGKGRDTIWNKVEEITLVRRRVEIIPLRKMENGTG